MRVVIDGRGIGSEAEFHDKIAEAMDFPSYYGEKSGRLVGCLEY